MNEQGEIENCREYMGRFFGSLGKGARETFEGEKGCRNLARHFGYGIADSPESEWDDVIQDSYNQCVIFYGLKPPIDAKEWIKEVREGIRLVKK